MICIFVLLGLVLGLVPTIFEDHKKCLCEETFRSVQPTETLHANIFSVSSLTQAVLSVASCFGVLRVGADVSIPVLTVRDRANQSACVPWLRRNTDFPYLG